MENDIIEEELNYPSLIPLVFSRDYKKVLLEKGALSCNDSFIFLRNTSSGLDDEDYLKLFIFNNYGLDVNFERSLESTTGDEDLIFYVGTIKDTRNNGFVNVRDLLNTNKIININLEKNLNLAMYLYPVLVNCLMKKRGMGNYQIVLNRYK